MENIKLILLFIVFINVITVPITIYTVYKKIKSLRSPNASLLRYESQCSVFNTYDISEGDYIFIGDSHIERFNWKVPNKNTWNLGIGGETTERLLERIDNIPACTNVFISIGVNDIISKQGPFITSFNILLIYKKLKIKDCNVYFIKIPNVTHKWKYSKVNNDHIDEINEFITPYNMIDIDYLDNDTHDGLHLNGNGYRKLNNEIQKIIKS